MSRQWHWRIKGHAPKRPTNLFLFGEKTFRTNWPTPHVVVMQKTPLTRDTVPWPRWGLCPTPALTMCMTLPISGPGSVSGHWTQICTRYKTVATVVYAPLYTLSWSCMCNDQCSSRTSGWEVRSSLFTKSSCRQTLTLSPPIPLRLYTLPYWSNPPFLIFDIWALCRSVLSARAPKCQKLKMVG